MNFLLAFVLFSIGHGIGLPQVAEGVDAGTARNVKVQILEVVTGSPAAQAGILPGDTITRISSEEEHSAVVNIEDVQLFVNANLGKENSLHITRGTEKLVLVAVPRVDPPAGEGALGIAMVKTGIVSVPWYLAPWEGLKTTIAVTKGVAEGLTFFFGNLFRGEVMGDVAGPVGIAQVAGQAGRLGIIYLIQLTALLSINLAILNLLPIPALDGGRIFFIVVEKIRGVPISTRMTQFAHTVGFFLLIALMLFVTYRDIVRIL